MEVTAIGHGSWLVQSGATTILIDPVLTDFFGTEGDFSFSPPRKIIHKLLPHIDAIFLTTEHLQHFNPRSIKLLLTLNKFKNGRCDVYVPELFPFAGEKILNDIGLEAKRTSRHTPVRIGEVTIKSYPANNDTLFWDSRVVSLYIESGDSHSLFIQSDTSISEEFYSDISKNKTNSPDLLIVTNNFQKSAEGLSVGLENILPIRDKRYTRITGLRLLTELTSKPVKRLSKVPNIIISGNGYVNRKGNSSPIWKNSELAEIGSQLSINTSILSLVPGAVYSIEKGSIRGACDWIESIQEPVFLEPNTHQADQEISDIDDIVAHLNEMAKSWLITEYVIPFGSLN